MRSRPLPPAPMRLSGDAAMLTRKLFRTAWRYKAQFISMVLMIAIGTGIFLGFHMEWRSLEEDALTFLEDTGYADYRIYCENGFTEEVIEAIRGLDGVDAATRYFSANAGLKDTKKSVSLNVSENYTVSTMLVMEGAEYDETGDGIWLSDKFAEANDIRIGDGLTLTYAGIEISAEVAGLIKSGENMICVADGNQLMPDYESFGFAYITPKTLERALGFAFYPQINILSDLEKAELEKKIKDITGTTFLVMSKSEHISYAGVISEVEEGQTMGSILPVLFLAIAVLTMVTTMHRIAAKEKVQIGTLKALGFRDRKILLHYTSYGLLIGLFGSVLGVGLGYFVASLIISPRGMMSTYLDIPDWRLVMPKFCIPVMALMLALLTTISYLSVRKMLRGTAADALRPYAPKAMRKSAIEKLPFWEKLSFGAKWNTRDILRHKSRSAMTLVGVFGCMLLLVGGLGMRDTMTSFLDMLDHGISNYATKVILSESAANGDAVALADELNGDWQAASGISYEGKTISLEVYRADNHRIRFLSEDNELIQLADDGVYLCLRLKDTAEIGDIITFSPYGSEETYEVRVAGYLRSLVSECMVMTGAYADSIGLAYHIGSICTAIASEDIEESAIISGKQSKDTIMDSYDTLMKIMNVMIAALVAAAIVLGIVVLYNLGVMSYVECYRELATLKVLGFRDRQIGKLLITQNIWLTLIGAALGLPGGAGVLCILVAALASEYEMSVAIGPATCIISIALTFGVSLLVGWMVSEKNRKIDMVDALKCAE